VLERESRLWKISILLVVLYLVDRIPPRVRTISGTVVYVGRFATVRYQIHPLKSCSNLVLLLGAVKGLEKFSTQYLYKYKYLWELVSILLWSLRMSTRRPLSKLECRAQYLVRVKYLSPL
jgi:hypothetical protein